MFLLEKFANFLFFFCSPYQRCLYLSISIFCFSILDLPVFDFFPCRSYVFLHFDDHLLILVKSNLIIFIVVDFVVHLQLLAIHTSYHSVTLFQKFVQFLQLRCQKSNFTLVVIKMWLDALIVLQLVLYSGAALSSVDQLCTLRFIGCIHFLYFLCQDLFGSLGLP